MNAAHDWRHAVICTKASGVRLVFGSYPELREAEHTVARLRELGIIANVERARVGVLVPGATIQARTAAQR